MPAAQRVSTLLFQQGGNVVIVLNKICFTVSIVCIALGTALSLVMIWGDFADDEFLWKSWLTLLVLFLASLLTMVVNTTVGRLANDGKTPKRQPPEGAEEG